MINSGSKGKTLRITESEIKNIVRECVQRICEDSDESLKFTDDDGCEWEAVTSFRNGKGIGYIVEDDGCYLIYTKGKNGYWRSEYIFPEAFEALKKLPNPDTLG